jgi:hypothetical protein
LCVTPPYPLTTPLGQRTGSGRQMGPSSCAEPDGGDGGFPIQIGGGFLYNTYPNVSCMYPACILHVFRCVLSRYIKIHQDTFVSVTLAMMMASKHSDNPRDMYPACILHVSCMYFDVSYQDTSRYIKIHQDTFVSVTLAMMMASKHSDNPRDMYPACIPHVSRMYLACVEHVS